MGDSDNEEVDPRVKVGTVIKVESRKSCIRRRHDFFFHVNSQYLQLLFQES